MEVTKLKPKIANESGIYPSGDRVLVQPDPIEEYTDGGIYLPEQHLEKYYQAQASGTLIAVGPDAWVHEVDRKYKVHQGRRELVEETVTSFSEPFAEPGDRVSYAMYTGKAYKGKDGERYLVLNDRDITCRIDEEIELTALDTRKGLGTHGRKELGAGS